VCGLKDLSIRPFSSFFFRQLSFRPLTQSRAHPKDGTEITPPLGVFPVFSLFGDRAAPVTFPGFTDRVSSNFMLGEASPSTTLISRAGWVEFFQVDSPVWPDTARLIFFLLLRVFRGLSLDFFLWDFPITFSELYTNFSQVRNILRLQSPLNLSCPLPPPPLKA